MLKKNIWAAIAGLVFGLGLILSGMTNPAKVIGFWILREIGILHSCW